jgi:hypothetical protein
MSIPNHDDPMMGQVQTYREKVTTYEALQKDINTLLSAYGGGTEGMNQEDLARYRILARQRDETLNEMRWLEQQLLDEDA